jgi:hypothetical protein
VVRACKTNHPDLPDCSTYGGFHAWWGLIVWKGKKCVTIVSSMTTWRESVLNWWTKVVTARERRHISALTWLLVCALLTNYLEQLHNISYYWRIELTWKASESPNCPVK